MIASMTAFVRTSQQAEWGCITAEMRSVNHRYLDLNIKLPDNLRVFESAVREILQQHLKRGKVDLYIKFQPGEVMPYDFKLNPSMLNQLAGLRQQIDAVFPGTHLDLMSLLNWQGLLQTSEKKSDVLGKVLLALIEQAVQTLLQQRQREGEGIEHFMLDRLSQIGQHVSQVETLMPALLKSQREKLMTKFDEMKLDVDQERLEQEMVWLAQKADVAEEMQRLQSHVQEVSHVLKKGGVVGRRLDFLMQELNREANTLASKSIDTKVTQAAVDIKVLIEQMREQVQNIE